jgi:hypothetical protein
MDTLSGSHARMNVALRNREGCVTDEAGVSQLKRTIAVSTARGGKSISTPPA